MLEKEKLMEGMAVHIDIPGAARHIFGKEEGQRIANLIAERVSNLNCRKEMSYREKGHDVRAQDRVEANKEWFDDDGSGHVCWKEPFPVQIGHAGTLAAFNRYKDDDPLFTSAPEELTRTELCERLIEETIDGQCPMPNTAIVLALNWSGTGWSGDSLWMQNFHDGEDWSMSNGGNYYYRRIAPCWSCENQEGHEGPWSMTPFAGCWMTDFYKCVPSPQSQDVPAAFGSDKVLYVDANGKETERKLSDIVDMIMLYILQNEWTVLGIRNPVIIPRNASLATPIKGKNGKSKLRKAAENLELLGIRVEFRELPNHKFLYEPTAYQIKDSAFNKRVRDVIDAYLAIVNG